MLMGFRSFGRKPCRVFFKEVKNIAKRRGSSNLMGLLFTLQPNTLQRVNDAGVGDPASEIVQRYTVYRRARWRCTSLAQSYVNGPVRIAHDKHLLLEKLVRPAVTTANPMAVVQKLEGRELAHEILLIIAQGSPGHGHGDECGVQK